MDISILADNYAKNDPFPHVIIDNFLSAQSANQGATAFPLPTDPAWMYFSHYNEDKCAIADITKMPSFFSDLIRDLSSTTFLAELENLTRIRGLLADPNLQGGGLHMTKRGGYLNIHADFTAHPIMRTWRRRINLLLYFNSQWDEGYEGHLELWARDMTTCLQRVAPILNRCVIFNTDESSFHGVPTPLNCPASITRNSLALYYYTESNLKVKLRSTNYQTRPNTSDRNLLIWIDKLLVAIFTRLKSNFALSDEMMSKVLKRVKRRKRD